MLASLSHIYIFSMIKSFKIALFFLPQHIYIQEMHKINENTHDVSYFGSFEPKTSQGFQTIIVLSNIRNPVQRN